MMNVLGMYLPWPAFFLLVIDPTFPPANSRRLATDFTDWYKRWTQRPRTANENPPSPSWGDWFRHGIKPGQLEPLDLTIMWVNTFPFFFLRQSVILPLADEKKIQTNTIISKELQHLVFFLFSTNSFLLFLFFSPAPIQLLKDSGIHLLNNYTVFPSGQPQPCIPRCSISHLFSTCWCPDNNSIFPFWLALKYQTENNFMQSERALDMFTILK